jgi:hypothetical protein
VTLVAGLVGVGDEACSIQFDTPAGAYIALEVSLPGFRHRDSALLWDETHGWAMAIETHSGADLTVLGYLGGDIVPPPGEVAGYLWRAVGGAGTGRPSPPVPRPGDDLPGRLAGYAPRVTVDVV